MTSRHFHWITTATALLAAVGAASTLLLAPSSAPAPEFTRAVAAVSAATS